MLWHEALILGIIEGITEFLPISSTGHMILTSHFLKMTPDEFHKAFEVIIQFGAILSVVILYWKKFLAPWNYYFRLFWAFLPTGILGFLLKDVINQFLESVNLVAWSLIVGGVVLAFADSIFKSNETKNKTEADLSLRQLLGLGLYQSISMIPGVSRSGATIVGGLIMGLTRKEAAEFSFLLAVPTMAAATGYKLLKVAPLLHKEHFSLLTIGFITAFIVAMISIRFMMGIVQKYGFKPFGIYRILAGVVILIFN